MTQEELIIHKAVRNAVSNLIGDITLYSYKEFAEIAIREYIKLKDTEDVAEVNESDIEKVVENKYEQTHIPLTQMEQNIFHYNIPQTKVEITQDKDGNILSYTAVIDTNTNNNTEPKFKVGNWIIDNKGNVAHINEVRKDSYETLRYYIEWANGIITDPLPCLVDDEFHLWTIQDAKDGDVLYYKNNGIEYIVMNKGINESSNIDSYFRYNSLCGFGIDIPSVLSAKYDSITPATKEQCNFLFQKMKDAGYEWDAEKKELKKIEQKPFDYENANIPQKDFAPKAEPKFKVGDWVARKDNQNFSSGNKFAKITEIDKGKCWFETRTWIETKNLILWTINDAKDGDVLALEWKDEYQWQKIVIFKSLNETGVEGYGNTFKNNKLAFKEDVPYYSKTWTKLLHPATKEQRDLLFQKMKEAGYVWDAEKKELIKKHYSKQ